MDHPGLLVTLRRTVAATGQALILVVWIGLRAVVLLVLAVEYLLLILLEGAIAGRVDLVRHERLNVCAHWLTHSIHMLLCSKLVLIRIARELLLLYLRARKVLRHREIHRIHVVQVHLL